MHQFLPGRVNNYVVLVEIRQDQLLQAGSRAQYGLESFFQGRLKGSSQMKESNILKYKPLDFHIGEESVGGINKPEPT